MNNKIEELRKEQQALNDKINALEQELKQTEPQGKWKPKMGEMYWIADVTNQNFCDFDYWDDKEYHFHLYNAGLIRKTENEAIELGKQMYYTQWFNDLSDVTDEMWEDFSITKYYVYYAYTAKTTVNSYDTNCRSAETAYFTSEEKLEQAIETIGRENFEKYVMRIKGD